MAEEQINLTFVENEKAFLDINITNKKLNYRVGDNVSTQALVNSLNFLFMDMEKRNPGLAAVIFTASASTHLMNVKTATEFRDYLNKVIDALNANSNREAAANH